MMCGTILSPVCVGTPSSVAAWARGRSRSMTFCDMEVQPSGRRRDRTSTSIPSGLALEKRAWVSPPPTMVNDRPPLSSRCTGEVKELVYDEWLRHHHVGYNRPPHFEISRSRLSPPCPLQFPRCSTPRNPTP